MLAFLIKAAVAALKKFPEFNASPRRRPDRPEEVLPHRLRRRHAERPGRAGDQGRRQEGRAADLARDGRAREEGARRQADAGRHERRVLLDLVARRHRRALLHADHQRARGRDPRRLPQHDRAALGRQGVPAAPDPAALAELGPPRRSTAPRRRASTRSWSRSSATSGGCCCEAGSIESRFPTSATSRTSRSSRCWSSRATRSRSSRA